LLNNTCPFTVSFPLPLPFTIPILSDLPFLLAILCSLPLSGPILTALHVLRTLPVVKVITIAKTSPFTARCSDNHSILIIIILIHYLIPIWWSTSQEVPWFVLMAD
jgi:hypothetical protein